MLGPLNSRQKASKNKEKAKQSYCQSSISQVFDRIFLLYDTELSLTVESFKFIGDQCLWTTKNVSS